MIFFLSFHFHNNLPLDACFAEENLQPDLLQLIFQYMIRKFVSLKKLNCFYLKIMNYVIIVQFRKEKKNTRIPFQSSAPY